MILRYRKPFAYSLDKRIFEGKNDSPLTSKYMPSYKWCLTIYFNEGEPSITCYRTQKDAYQAYNQAKEKAGKII